MCSQWFLSTIASIRLRNTTTMYRFCLQEKLDISQWREMTVDLTITPQDVSISNVRQILFAGGKWVGNYISPELEVPEAHKAVLMQVGAYAAHTAMSPKALTAASITSSRATR